MAQEPRSTDDTIIVETKKAPGDAYEYEKFIFKLDQFNRKLGGCPKTGHLEICYAPNGVYDAKLWNELRKQAAKVFHLPLPKNK